MRARVALLALLVACGEPGPGPASPPSAPTAGGERPAAIEAPALSPCRARPPSVETLSPSGQRGVIVVDASAPRELGACVSPALVAREGAITCEGVRCRVGERAILTLREVDDRCEPIALVRYEGEPPGDDSDELLAAIAERPEACALHDRVVAGDAALYEPVERARRIASGSGSVLVAECLRDDDARALAADARERFAAAALRCTGLRCESAGGREDAAPPGSLLFANRLSGPLRFDAAVWVLSPAEHPQALELLRRRCR